MHERQEQGAPPAGIHHCQTIIDRSQRLMLFGTLYMQGLFMCFKPINGVQTHKSKLINLIFYVSILNKSCSSKEDYYKDMTTKHTNTSREKEIKVERKGEEPMAPFGNYLSHN